MTTPPPLKDDCFALPPGVHWTPVTEALQRLRDAVAPVCATQTVALDAALGRIAAQDFVAAQDHPPHANSAVDGYGVAAGSLPKQEVLTLPLLAGRAAAGAPYIGRVPPGQALRVLTGAMIPDGVDTVILQEDVTLSEGQIAFRGPLKPGANARAAGEDLQSGQVVVRAGQRIGVADLAVLASVGVAEVTVRRPLRVGVLSTGDEVVPAGAPRAPGQIFDANRPMLLGLLASWGYTAVDLGQVPDDPQILAQVFDGARETCDAVLSTGGASAGDEDHVSALLKAQGHLHTWRIAIKPGRPLALAQWGGVPVFGFPGNPVAAFVCALIFARPALCVLAGGDWPTPQAFELPAGFEKRKKPGRSEYLRARVGADGRVQVFASEGSGRVSGLSWATGLVELPPEGMHITPGDVVRYLPWGSFDLPS